MRRTYGQYCALARALDQVGERWTLLILRELAVGPRRYKDLLTELPGIGTNLLAARLQHLQEHGIVEKSRQPPPAASTVYELTSRGTGLVPALLELTRWGLDQLADKRPQDHYSARWAPLAIQAAVRDGSAGFGPEDDGTYVLVVGEERIVLELSERALNFPKEPYGSPRARLETSLPLFRSVVEGDCDFRAAVSNGDIQIHGDRDALLRVLRAIPLPHLSDTPA